jgi:hypothetical protein
VEYWEYTPEVPTRYMQVLFHPLHISVQTEQSPPPPPAISPLYNRTRCAKHRTRDTCDVRRIKEIRKELSFYVNIDIPIFSWLKSAFYFICPLSKGQTITFSIGNT